MALILIADDSPTEVYVLQKMLEQNGHEVLIAEDGVEAVDKATADQPDLVLMDVVMPNLNGFQATRKLTKASETSHIPIIIVSSKNQETDKMWGLRQGARGYLGKPVAEKELLEQINALLED